MKKCHLIPLFSWLILFASCSNDKKNTSETGGVEKKSEQTTGTNNSGENIISFSVNGELVKSTGWNISRFELSASIGTATNVTSNMHEQPKTINININGDKTGNYPLGGGFDAMKTAGHAYGSYHPDYKKDISNSYSFKDGEFVILSVDTTAGLFNATFHGTATNGKGESVTITDGKVINGKLRPGITKMN